MRNSNITSLRVIKNATREEGKGILKIQFIRFLKSVLMIVAMLGVAACGKDKEDNPPAPYLSVSSNNQTVSSLTINAAGATQTLDVKSNTSWTVRLTGSSTDPNPNWIRSNTSNDKNSITIIVDNNTALTNRQAKISFVGSDQQELAAVTVTQAGYGPSLLVTPDSTGVTTEGGNVSFQIASNSDAWEYTTSGNLTLTETAKTATSLTFSVSANTGDAKSAKIVFKLTSYPDVTKEVAVTQEDGRAPAFITLNTPSTAEINLGDSEEVKFEWTGTNITGGYVVEVSTSNNMSNIIQSVETDTESLTMQAITLDIALFENSIASGNGTSFYWKVKPKNAAVEPTQTLEVRELKLKRPTVKTDAVHGDMLDVVFAPNAAATDVSGNNYTIEHKDYDHTTKIVYNKTYQRYMAVFNPAQGNGGGTGASTGDYYRFDYNATTTIQPFIDKLGDGHSFECLVKLDFDYTTNSVNYETKFFSTHGGGGTGFLVTNAAQSTGGNSLAFIPNVGGWKWTNSQIKPDGNTYYHLVGVWDKDAGQSYLYVDGVLKGQAGAAGNYTPPSQSSRWVCVGGDAANGLAEGCFKGNVIIARIYDRVLTQTEVTTLWDQVK